MLLRSIEDEKRMAKLEEELKDARNQAEDADKKYDEVQLFLAQLRSMTRIRPDMCPTVI